MTTDDWESGTERNRKNIDEYLDDLDWLTMAMQWMTTDTRPRIFKYSCTRPRKASSSFWNLKISASSLIPSQAFISSSFDYTFCCIAWLFAHCFKRFLNFKFTVKTHSSSMGNFYAFIFLLQEPGQNQVNYSCKWATHPYSYSFTFLTIL